jgi:hypothetical protein
MIDTSVTLVYYDVFTMFRAYCSLRSGYGRTIDGGFARLR